ncbi:FtsX-like permease family protein [candidate division KSB1 bacterium]
MNKKSPKEPPHIAEFLLSIMRGYDEKYASLGDFAEFYNKVYQKEGFIKARLWYWSQVFNSLLPYLWFKICWLFIMFTNYLKISFRNIKRQKAYSFINIFGFAVGMACCLLIMLYVRYELSYDNYHGRSENIYRVLKDMKGRPGMSRWMPGPLAQAMKNDFPEVLKTARVDFGNGMVICRDKIYLDEKFYFADQEYLEIFTVDIISGDPKQVLTEPNTLIISRSKAEQLFGEENPVGKTINFKYGNDDFYKITGVFTDQPENSHFRYDFLASFKTLESQQRNSYLYSWRYVDCSTYLLLSEKADIDELVRKMPDFYKKYSGTAEDYIFEIQPLRKIHVENHVRYEFEPGNNIKFLYLLSSISLIIMLIACFNYMNLSTARSSTRAKEVGLRKVVGATRRQLLKQLIGESLIFSAIAIVLSLIFVMAALPYFNSFVGRNIEFYLFGDLQTLAALLGLVILTGLISGSYPALFLSSFQPVKILQGNFKLGSRGSRIFRNLLVISQFAVSIVLIFCTIVISRQLNFIKNRDLGFDKKHIVSVNIEDYTLRRNHESFMNEFRFYPGITDITVSGSLPNAFFRGGDAQWEGKEESQDVYFWSSEAGYNFIDFFNIDIVQGRNFSKEFATDADKAYILNETAVKEIGWTDAAAGKKFGYDGSEGTVIGVVRDYHFNSLHKRIAPLILVLNKVDDTFYSENPFRCSTCYISFKIKPDKIKETLNFIELKFKEKSPGYGFSYTFFEDRVEQMYLSEIKLGKVFNFSSALAVLLACLGLFGLTSFISEQKIKEIGIRKALGASSGKIVIMLSKGFVKWILTAAAISLPAANYAIGIWLNNFAYKINIGVWIFAAAVLFALLITVLTAARQTLKAASANPVDSLKYE